MGQWGAQGYALHGFTYDDILAADYPGTVLSQTTVRKIRVLLADGQKRLTVSSDKPIAVVDGTGAEHTLPAGEHEVHDGAPVSGAADALGRAGATLTLGNAYRGKLVISLVERKAPRDQRRRPSSSTSTASSRPRCRRAGSPTRSRRRRSRRGRTPSRAGSRVRAYDVSVSGQSYLGVAAETPQGDAAVNATKGQVLTYDGKVATTVYSSSTGGWSQSAADAWGGGAPYLVSVKDPYDTISPYHDWGPVFVTGKDLAAALELSGKPVDATVTRNGSKRVAQLDRHDACARSPSPHVSVTGDRVAVALNLRSTWFSVGVLSLLPPSPNVAVIAGTTSRSPASCAA